MSYTKPHILFGSVEIIGGNISNNSATNGGGCGVEGGALSIRQDSTISNNTATSEGGGIYASHTGDYLPCYLSIYGTRLGVPQVTDNTSSRGGGLYLEGLSAVFLSSCVISNNSANSGGGIYAMNIQGGRTVKSKSGDYVGLDEVRFEMGGIEDSASDGNNYPLTMRNNTANNGSMIYFTMCENIWIGGITNLVGEIKFVNCAGLSRGLLCNNALAFLSRNAYLGNWINVAQAGKNSIVLSQNKEYSNFYIIWDYRYNSSGTMYDNVTDIFSVASGFKYEELNTGWGGDGSDHIGNYYRLVQT